MSAARSSGAGVFWLSAGVVAGTYVGFPLATLLRARTRPRPVAAEDITPTVTVVIAAHNEEAGLERKLHSVIECDYPHHLVEILVASDGSTDRTVEIAESFRDDGVTALDLSRAGKAAALNAARPLCRGDIVVFSDANNPLDRAALRELVRPFADPVVGGVAGDQRYRGDDENAAGERGYWAVDRVVKLAESGGGNVISATGALYAVRRELFPSVIDGVTDDFWISTNVVQQGRRLVHAPDAVVWEVPAPRSGMEFQRKVRVMTRGLRGAWGRRALLDPRAFGYYSIQLLCHKLLRRLMVAPILAMWVGSLLAARRGGLGWKAAAAAQTAGHITGIVGVRWHPAGLLGRLVALAGYFTMVNAASAVAVWNLLRGRQITVWEPARVGEGQ